MKYCRVMDVVNQQLPSQLPIQSNAINAGSRNKGYHPNDMCTKQSRKLFIAAVIMTLIIQRYTERLSPSAKLSFRGKASSRNERTSHEHPGRSLSPTLGQWLLVRPPASWRPRA